MIPKYTIEFATNLKKHAHTGHHSTDDPVECEAILEDLLDRGFAIRAVKHEGVDLPQAQFDKMIRAAANL